MDFTNIVTFIINNKQYYLHYDLVKDLPIFEELKKSDKLETIDYPDTISRDEINIAFSLICNVFNKNSSLSIDNCYKVYQFMMYLTIDKLKIKQYMDILLKDFKHEEIVDYGIQNKLDTNFFNKFPFYKENWMDGIGVFILNFKNDDNIKLILVDKITRRLKKYKHVYAPNRSSVLHLFHGRFGEEFYIKIFNKNVGCNSMYNWTYSDKYNGLSSYSVNNKKIELVDVIESFINVGENNKYLAFDVYGAIVNHIKQVLLGEVEL